MKISFFNFKKLSAVRSIFKGVPWFLGKHPFWVILLLAVIAMALGGFLFYNYVIIVENSNPAVNQTPFKFTDDVYQRVLSNWHAGDQQANYEEYSNPFKNDQEN